MHWRRNPQRVAWTVLVASFVLWMGLAIATPLAARNYILHATSPRPAQVTAMEGTVQLWTPRAEEPNAVTERRTVAEGSQIVTDSTARALLTIADSTGLSPLFAVQLFPESSVRLEQVRTPRFRWSNDPDRFALFLERGRISITSRPESGRTITGSVRMPGARATFSGGAFYFSMQGDETQVTARLGAIRVLAADAQVTAVAGERVRVLPGRAPELPVPAAVNVVRNGTFDAGLATDWQEVVDVSPGRQAGQIILESNGQRREVRFVRRAEDGIPNRTGIRQILNRDVRGFDSLVLRLDVQLLYQSVPGGGYLSSEYPVMAEIAYTDVYGKDLYWYQGFYYLDLPSGSNYKLPAGEKLPLGAWYISESPNLLELLRDTRPARINSITISASGHDYESRIADVALTVR